MKEDLYDDLYEEKEEKIDFHALLFRYVIRWPWFVASVIICNNRSDCFACSAFGTKYLP